ncbi:MAG: hypothetical protein ISR51_08180 [Rhodospirillales bacterium]|nr:hypothetical protein [Alphaproteobacteria bacterium]MBL6948640.1 hypothetical protein [Rhodospirillales bacterium]
MNFVIMILVAAALYFLSDRVLERIEQSRGARFKERSVVFFGIFLGSMLVVFLILDKLLGMGM